MSDNALKVIKNTLYSNAMQDIISQRIGEKAGTFTTSLMDLMGANSRLQECDTNLVILEALKAAALDLPINPNLGMAFIVPYKNKGVLIPKLQIGYKGIIQLALRTGYINILHTDAVYEGETVEQDRIMGLIEITGTQVSEKAIGYFAYMRLTSGFESAVYWTKEKVHAHAQKFSKSYFLEDSGWQTNPDAMCKKTMLLQLKTFMPLSIDMQQALASDKSENREQPDLSDANSEVINIPAPGKAKIPEKTTEQPEISEKEAAEINKQEIAEARQSKENSDVPFMQY